MSTDRNISIAISVDTTGLDRLTQALKAARNEAKGLGDDWKSLGGGPGRGASAAQGGAARPESMAGRATDTFLRDLNRWAGVHDRKFDRMVTLLQAISQKAGLGGGSRRGGGGMGVGGALAGALGGELGLDGLLDGGGGGQRGLSGSDRKRIAAFMKGSQISQLGSSIGGGTGELLQGVGGIASGAAGGGLVGAGLGAANFLVNFSENRRKEMEANLAKRKAQANEDAEKTFETQARGQSAVETRIRMRRLLTDPGVRGLDEDLARERGKAGDEREAIQHRISMIGRNRADSTFQGSESGQKQIARELEEEKRLRTDLVAIKQREIQLENEKVDAVNRSRSGLQQEVAGLDAQIAGEKRREGDIKAEFGGMSRSQQQRTVRIAEKLDRGEKLTRSEERFAGSSTILKEDARAIAEKKADGAGFDSSAIRRRASSSKKDELEMLKANLQEQIKDLDVKAPITLAIANKEKLLKELQELGKEAGVVTVEVTVEQAAQKTATGFAEGFAKSVMGNNAAGP